VRTMHPGFWNCGSYIRIRELFILSNRLSIREPSMNFM